MKPSLIPRFPHESLGTRLHETRAVHEWHLGQSKQARFTQTSSVPGSRGEKKKHTRAWEQDYRFVERTFMSCMMFILTTCILIGASHYIIAIGFAYAWYCLLNLSR